MLSAPGDLADDDGGHGARDTGATPRGPWLAGLAAGVSSPTAVVAQSEAAGEAAAAAAAAAAARG